MIDKVKEAIDRFRMLTPGERVCVALSGGADSVSLLLCLKELGCPVFAVHVNHNLRGEESERDMRFCERLCTREGIELYIENADVKAYCEKNRCSVELGARKLRYDALFKLSNGAKIATAHTLSDNIETVILNMTRGSGTKGLCGIPPVRGKIIRPMIFCTRSDVEEYLGCKGQDFVTDSTNLLPDCSRNIIRLRVIPELKKINQGLEKSFKNAVCAVSEADEFIAFEAKKYLGDLAVKEYDFTKESHPSVISRAISEVLRQENIEPTYERISEIKELIKTDGRINIKKGVYLCSQGGRLRFERSQGEPLLFEKLSLRQSCLLGSKELIVTKISPFDVRCFNKAELRYLIDEKRLAGEYIARNYIGSEKIRLPERGFSSTVKKLLSSLSESERRRAVVIADAFGAVFVEGIGVSERLCCSDSTSSALKIEIHDIKEREYDRIGKCQGDDTEGKDS